ncbi:MAG TPA: carboxylate--amine ligase, partial [Myxococcaceae bacterium]
MNVLFLSPNFPPQFHLFCRALKGEGITALGIGDSPPHDVSPLLSEAVTEYQYLRDLNQYGDVLRAVGYLTWRHGKIDRIDSLNEHWLPLEARLREDFNVEGPRPAELRRHRSKTGMREIFTAAGVPCTEGEPVTSADGLRAYARRAGYPLVIKPDVGVGAWSTFKVSSAGELEAALRSPLEGYVVERFAEGELV